MAGRLVVVGASLGGLGALEAVVSALPGNFETPVAVAQHRCADSGGELAAALRRRTGLPVREPDDKEPIEPGCIYIAPAGYHLLVEDGAFALSTTGPVNWARPSIDVLFESAADAYGEAVVAVVLTGASADGALGAVRVKARGGIVIVQDPVTAESAVMPRAALRATEADDVLPLDAIGGRIARLCRSAPPHGGAGTGRS